MAVRLGLVLVVLAWGFCGEVAQGDEPVKSLIRVDVSTEEAVQALKQVLRSWDVAGTVAPGKSLDLVVDETERLLLEAEAIPFEVVIEDIEKEQAATRASYHTFAGMESALATMASSYPAITQLTSLGDSWEGRDIWCLEISDNPGVDEGEVGVAYMGLHHAREWPSLEVSLDIADRLTSEYGVDPTITNLVNSHRIWVIPCVNPDGYVYCHDQGHDWRKNRHYFSQFGTYGVDLNRNYAGSSNGVPDGAWGSVGAASVSHNSDQEVYMGPAPFSEPETQVIRDFCNTRDITILITYHTHGELVLWSWGYDGSSQTDDNAIMVSIGQGIAGQIGGQYGGTYTPQQSAYLYPTTGDTTDWAYGYSYYELGKNTLAYTIEIAQSFQPPTYQLQQILDENWDGALYALQQAAYAHGQMTPFVLPPLMTAPGHDADGDYTISWTQKNPDAGATKYALQELTGLSKLTDGAESGTGNWTMQQFSRTTSRKHSGSYSFKAASGDEVIAAMTTTDPLPVETGDTLSFWTWYNIEIDWDMAIVEVSVDGRFYDILDMFTGSSNWTQKTYSLDAYAGQSVYIRFRYTTDAAVTEEGFYVDDIYPVASWASITTLDNNITGTSYPITGRSDGEYYYRVSGSNPEHGFGEYCSLQMTTVGGLLGDLNCDGAVNGFDIDAFVLLLNATPPNYPEYYAAYPDCDHLLGDMNDDGLINGFDIDGFVALLGG
ncbi:MAG: immune inhibitor A [Planctomycetes bacterium]|nr:immune inhibitor A [Planctomycetota bacterium]